MICLGIESTAHTFGVGIVDSEGNIIGNSLDMYRAPDGWGIEPIKAAQHHREIKDKVLEDALSGARLKLNDIDLVAFSQGAGLPPCLQVGLGFAKELAIKNNKPLVPVCHQIAHVEIGKLCTGARDPVILYVSGANTQILTYISGKYRCTGETQDVGIGNAIDKFGREMGLGFPAGPRIEQLALKGKWVELPYTVKGMDLAFSGIITDAIRKAKGQSKLGPQKLEDICFSLQETLFAMLTEVTERALAHVGKKEVLVTGGVGANKRLAEMMGIMCKERGARAYIVPLEYSGDNGSMVAWAGMLARKHAVSGNAIGDIGIKPNQRTDDVEVTWL